MKKFFIITVDTEGYNLWEYIKGSEIQTQNARFIQPFQDLCEKFGFKPVYLTNYEMANNEDKSLSKLIRERKLKCVRVNRRIFITKHRYSNNVYLYYSMVI